MSENNNKLKSLDEIVFEGRNKAYGAYDMRMSEKSTLLKAFIRGFIVIAILAFGLIASATGLFESKKSEDVVVDVQLEDLNIPEPPKEEEVVEPEPPKPEPEQRYQEETAQVRVVMPEPKAQPKKEEPIVEVKEMADKDLGLVDREGPKSTTQTGGANEVNTKKEAPKDTPATPNPGKGTEPAAPSTVTARTAAVMAVYPGCEKDAAKGKQAATDCLSKKLSQDLQDELQDFANDAAGQGLSGVVAAKLSFQIDTEGRIVGISPMGDAKLGPEAKKALERITQRQQKRGKTIKPAQTEDGRAAKLNFNIPVKMQIE